MRGGVSPGCASGKEALTLICKAIELAPLTPGEDVVIAIYVAGSSFKNSGCQKNLTRKGKHLFSEHVIYPVEAYF